MTEKKIDADLVDELRKRAEEVTRGKSLRMPESIETLSPEDGRRLLDELRVHQIELEMQNEELRRAQAELEASQARYFDLYDLAPVGYVTLNEQGLIVETNLTAATLLGVTRIKLVGQPLSRFIHSKDQDIYYRYRKQLSKTGAPQAYELRLLRQDGSSFWAQLEATEAQQADGAPGCRVVLSDITERKQTEDALRESEEKYRNLVKYAPAAIYEMDLQGTKFLSVNDVMCDILRYSREELLATKPSDLMDQESRTLFEERLRKKLAGENLNETVEYRIRRKDGEWIYADINVGGFSYKDEKATQVVVVGHDITARKKMEQALRQSNSALAGINEILHTAFTCETETDLGRACLDVAEKITQSQFGFIGEINKKGLEDVAISDPGWEACNVLDPSGHRVEHRNFKIHGIFGRVLSDGKSLFTNDPAHHPDSIGLPNGHPPLRSFLGVPLIRDGLTIGILAVGNREGGYTQMQQDALEALMPAIVEAFMRKRAEEALRRSRDELEIRVLERTSDLATANEELRHLSSKLMSAQEEERKRFAGEIHDAIGSCLSAIKFKVESAVHQIGDTAPGTTESLKTIIPVVQESIDECRRIQTDLRPAMLDDLGLLPTLSWFYRRFQTIYSGVRVEQEIAIQENDIPQRLRIVLFRVIQEAMNNIAKHSKADLVRFSLRKLDDRMELVLQDNGRGFSPEKLTSQGPTLKGLGLASMKERAELSGGSFDIESVEGKGSIIRASWPFGKKG